MQKLWKRRASWVALLMAVLLTGAALVVQLRLRQGEGLESGEESTTSVDSERFDSSKAPQKTQFAPRPIGLPFTDPPRISHVQINDLDEDGLLDVLVCDCSRNTVSWIRQGPKGVFDETVLAEPIPAPARTECIDFDGDGDKDLLVAALGQLQPSNDHIGSVLVLENNGDETFTQRVLLSGVPRVADVRAGDLDGDKDLDLVVTHFGYDQGEVRWLRNVSNWKFESEVLQSLAGGIHGIIHDMNGDTQPDIVVLISQQTEKIFVFEGDGAGVFQEHAVYAANNPDYGSAGIEISDLDRDGDPDILYCNGDAFDYLPPRPWPWHGVQWLENQGELRFEARRLVNLGGAVCARPSDIDGDQEIDIFVTSAFNDWSTPESPSLILLHNEGSMAYQPVRLANSPTHIQTLDVADIDADGAVDLVTGGMHISEPYDRVERVVLWLGLPEGDKASKTVSSEEKDGAVR